MKLVNTAQMRTFEQRADREGNSFDAMMEHAGTLTARAMQARWNVQNKRVLVLIGPGNNGGDGLVCARVLHDAEADVALYVWRRVPSVHDKNWNSDAMRIIPFTRAEDDKGLQALAKEVSAADFIVDAFLGTGVTRPIEGLLQEVLNKIRSELASVQPPPALVAPGNPAAPARSRPQVIAIDVPTGLNPDTGALDPAALPADLTVTFAFPKIGHYQFPGADAVGELVVADINIPQAWASELNLDVATGDEIRALLPGRMRDSNKGTFGKAMIACGSLNFTGAPVLAASAAGRAGAGLVTLAVPQSIHAVVAAKINEATFLPLIDRLGDWRPRAATELLATLWDSPYESLLVGCGLGHADSTREFLQRLLENLNNLEKPPALVLDADALNLMADLGEWWTQYAFASPPILTPHPGEMARLLGSDIATVQKDRLATARDAAQKWNAVVVLKGAFTVVAAPDGNVTVIPFANPALATAGTGDVLAGTIAGLLAQFRGASKHAESSDTTAQVQQAQQAYSAAVCGAYLHGLAGELAAADTGDAGMLAGDLLTYLPRARKKLGA